MKPSIKTMLHTLIILFGVIILVPAILLLYMTLDDYRPAPMETLTVSANPSFMLKANNGFSIMTWNIGYFGLGKEMDFFYDGGMGVRPGEEAYREYFQGGEMVLGETSGLDFYFLQEIDFRSKRTYYDEQFRKITGLFPGYGYAEAVNYKVRYVPIPLSKPMGRVLAGMATFSRYHVSESTRYAFVGDASWPAGLFMLDRCFILTRVPISGGKELVLINTHNSAFDDGSRRKEQLGVLREVMLTEYGRGNYVITGGDWNMNPVGYEIVPFSNGDVPKYILPAIETDYLPEGWQWAFNPDLPTNRMVDRPYQAGITPTTIIDFFVVSPNITVESITTVDDGFRFSDHQPVIMRFSLRESNEPGI